jgi:hypothetical protein
VYFGQTDNDNALLQKNSGLKGSFMKTLVIIMIMFWRLDLLGYVARKEDYKMRKKGLEDSEKKRQSS